MLLDKYKELEDEVKCALSQIEIPENYILSNFKSKLENMYKNFEIFLDQSQEEVIKDIISSILSGKHVVLYGPIGTGKTTLARKITELFGFNVKLVSAGEDWDSPEYLIGFQKLKNGSIKYEPGPLVEAILATYQSLINLLELEDVSSYGTWLIIDEMNRGNINSYLSSLITSLEPFKPEVTCKDFKEIYKIDTPEGPIYIPKSFRIIATMNTYDLHYLSKIPEAIRRRFSFIYIPPANNIDYEIQVIDNITYKFYNVRLDDGEKTTLRNLITLLRKNNINVGTAIFINLVLTYKESFKVFNLSNLDTIWDSAIAKEIVPLLSDLREGLINFNTLISELKRLNFLKSANTLEDIRRETSLF